MSRFLRRFLCIPIIPILSQGVGASMLCDVRFSVAGEKYLVCLSVL